jgi:hypothetical protein
MIADCVSDLGETGSRLIVSGEPGVRRMVPALCLVRVVDRPSDALDQLIGMLFVPQLGGRHVFVEGDCALALAVCRARNDDSRHAEFLPVVGPLGYRRRTDQGIKGD